MKGKILVSLFVGVLIGAAGMLVCLSGGVPWVNAACDQGGPCPPDKPDCPGACGNGDVDGNGDIAIQDAIYILIHLFKFGPPPVAFECPACNSCCGPATLTATGQTTCYSDGALANEIPCDSQDYPGQDGFYQAGCPMLGRFVDNGDGTVTDNCTGLMWQKDAADTDGDQQVTYDFDDVLKWQHALSYCANLEFAGYTDWRLPNVRELQSIMDYGRYSPAIDPVFNSNSVLYWSSTSLAAHPAEAWLVRFASGKVEDAYKTLTSYVRAVRGP